MGLPLNPLDIGKKTLHILVCQARLFPGKVVGKFLDKGTDVISSMAETVHSVRLLIRAF